MSAAVTAREALSGALAPLSTSPTGPHSPAQMRCPGCREFWAAVLAAEPAVADEQLAASALAGLVQVLPPAGHPGEECADCDGCTLEVEIGAQAVALGSVGLAGRLAWGPGHAPGQEHPQDWRACPSCADWVRDRGVARQALRAAGLDPERWLGPGDDPDAY